MKGFFSSGPESPSMSRLLAFTVTITALAIFAGASILAISKGSDMGPNIVNGCMWMVGLGLAEKVGSKFGENKKK